MGRGARRRPNYLGMKLRAIRLSLGGLSQGELIERLGVTGYIQREEISAFERGVREPDLLTLKAYADVAGVTVNDLIDDEADLPKPLLTTEQARKLSEKSQKNEAKAKMNTTTITLRLLIENEDDDRRVEKGVRRSIEKAHLERYGMKKLKDDGYELTFFHEDDADCDDQIYTLLSVIYIEARRLRCSITAKVREKGGDRYW
jgi:transcriptional regulator with XRE-family HTH domain